MYATQEEKNSKKYLLFKDEISGNFKHIKCFVVYRNSKNELMSYNHEGTQDLVISCQSDNEKTDPYGFTVSFNCHSVELREAETITKILKKIYRHVNKRENQYGNVKTYSQYVAYVCEALKIKGMVTENINGEYRYMDISQGINSINYIVGEWNK